VIKKPPHDQDIVWTENGGPGLAILSKELNIKIWEMKSDYHGVCRLQTFQPSWLAWSLQMDAVENYPS
jgi:hypothetical protein